MPAVEHGPVATPRTAPIRLRVRVTPGSARAEVVGRLGDAWKLRVRAAPERGRANADVVELLADRLGRERAEIRVVAGHGTRDKVVEVDGLGLEEAERRLAADGTST